MCKWNFYYWLKLVNLSHWKLNKIEGAWKCLSEIADSLRQQHIMFDNQMASCRKSCEYVWMIHEKDDDFYFLGVKRGYFNEWRRRYLHSTLICLWCWRSTNSSYFKMVNIDADKIKNVWEKRLSRSYFMWKIIRKNTLWLGLSILHFSQELLARIIITIISVS